MKPLEDTEVIYAYTRKQAVEDGEQIDVSEVAREAGIRFPVYLTRAAWRRYVKVPPKVQGQDEQSRRIEGQPLPVDNVPQGSTSPAVRPPPGRSEPGETCGPTPECKG